MAWRMSILQPLLSSLKAFWWLAPFALIALFLGSPWGKGLIGEWIVRWLADRKLPPETYHRFHNLLLPAPDGTTQVDHVIVSRYGVFVIETKNMRGWIYGRADEATWTQNIYGNKTKFQNPLRQNHKHVMAVAGALGVAPTTIHPIITFQGSAEFRTPMPNNVTVGAGFIGHIRTFTNPVYTEVEITRMVELLQEATRTSTLANQRAHVQALRARNDETRGQLCPRCGEPLVIRIASRGERAGHRFWGCSSYPKCRYTRDLDD